MKTVLRVNIGSALCLAALLSAGAALPEAPVADAAMRGDSEAVRALLQEGADVNAAQGDGMTALHWAAERGDADVAGMLIYAGANVRAVTRIGHYTPLHLASKLGSAPVIGMLVEAGADVNTVTTNTGATALHFAAASGSAEAVSVLLDRGADMEAREPVWGQTPLIFAAAYNRADAIRVLLERGADPDAASKAADLVAESAIARAASDRQEEVLEAFGVAEDGEPTPSQARAAAAAAREVYLKGEVPEEEEEEDDDDDDMASTGGLTPLLHAARQGHLEAVRTLLDGGVDIDKVSASDGTSPLLMATVNGQFDVAMLLIEHGADPNLASSLNEVAPLWATINSYWQPRTRFPQPREHEAQRATYLDVMEALLEAGANPDARIKVHPWYMVYSGCGNRNCGLEDTRGSTAFWRAAYGLDVDAMRLLVTYGADPNLATFKPPERRRRNIFDPDAPEGDPSGLPPVPVGGPAVFPIHAVSGVGYGEGFAGNAHRTVPDNWLPALRYVVEELGVDVNLRDSNGYTALHHAAARGDNEMILYLVSKGADVSVVSRSDQTPADMANGPYQRTSPYPATVQLLEALGSKNNNRCVTC